MGPWLPSSANLVVILLRAPQKLDQDLEDRVSGFKRIRKET
jgi:hypothetical protein